MKICLKLAHYAFSLSPSKDALMSTFCGFFFTFYWISLNLLMNIFPFQNVIANLSVSVASVCVCVRVCVYIHRIKTSAQAIIRYFFQCVLQKMVGWVALRFVIALYWSLNRLKCGGQCLFLSYCNSCSACEMSFLTGKGCPRKCAHCRSPRPKKFIYSLGQKGFKCNIRQKLNLNLIWFVSFKNKNWEMYCLFTAFHDL